MSVSKEKAEQYVESLKLNINEKRLLAKMLENEYTNVRRAFTTALLADMTRWNKGLIAKCIVGLVAGKHIERVTAGGKQAIKLTHETREKVGL